MSSFYNLSSGNSNGNTNSGNTTSSSGSNSKENQKDGSSSTACAETNLHKPIIHSICNNFGLPKPALVNNTSCVSKDLANAVSINSTAILRASLDSESSAGSDTISTISLGPSIRAGPLTKEARERIQQRASPRRVSPAKLPVSSTTRPRRLLPERTRGQPVHIQRVTSRALFPDPSRPRLPPSSVHPSSRKSSDHTVNYRFRHTQALSVDRPPAGLDQQHIAAARHDGRDRVAKFISRFETKRGSTLWNQLQLSSSDESSESEESESDSDSD